MNSGDDLEKTLEQMGSDWPGDSLAGDVLRRIESTQTTMEPRMPVLTWRRAYMGIAASLALVAALSWSFIGQSSLSAKAIQSLRRARSLHTITTTVATANRPAHRAMESWFERDVGFREEVGDEVRLSNQKQSWIFVKGTKTAMKSTSHGMNNAVNDTDNETVRALMESRLERYSAGDQLIDGQKCRAYLLTKNPGVIDPNLNSGKSRFVYYLDSRSRVLRIVGETLSGTDWSVRYTTDYEYDVPIDSALFEPVFQKDVEIVDADAGFGAFVDLDKAIHREERAGLWFAIHRAERFEHGGILVVSSVRGTPKTLEKYPLTERMVQRGLFFSDGPAVNYDASQVGDYFGLTLAGADHLGVNVRWWLLIPRGKPPTITEAGPGKVKIPVGITPHGRFAEDHFRDARGVIQHLTWEVIIDLPSPKSMPSVDTISRGVYTEVARLQTTPFRWLDLRSSNTQNYRDPKETDPTEFSQAVTAKIQYWFGLDVDFQLEFAKRLDPTIFLPELNPALHLGYNLAVDDATILRAAKRSDWKAAHLDGTRITDLGLRNLKGWHSLHQLSLADTSITDAGLRELESLISLKTLVLRNTKASVEGIARIKAAIPELKVETDLK